MNDLIIIGAGPGGYEMALEASHQGLVTTLIEADVIGGTCLNSGCIPTKSYYQNATFIRNLKKANNFGINLNSWQFDFNQARNRKDQLVKTLQDGINFALNQAKVNYIKGFAKIVDNHTVKVNDQLIQGDNIVIATGSRPIVIPGFEKALSSTDILNIKEIPQRLVIIGGGVIGIEMASIFHFLGAEVEVVEFLDSIIATADKEISKRLLSYLKTLGIKFHLSSKAISFDGSKVIIETKGLQEEIVANQVLVSIGRKPNIENLGLDEIGVKYTPKGIIVDEHFRTSIDNIYAIGDVTGRVMLAHYATYSGYQALKCIRKQSSKINFDLIPSCIFTFPEVAWIGLSEERCKELGFDYQVYKGLYRANGKAHTMDETDGFVKMIIADNTIKGVHIIGAEASILIHEMTALMNLKISTHDFKDIIHAHPTLSEILHSCLQ